MPATRRAARYLRTTLTVPFSHGSVSASNTPIVIAKTLTRPYRIGRVQYVNPTGLAANASNFFDIRILNGATIAAKWSTATAGEGALPANGEVDLTLQAAAARDVPSPPLGVATSISLALVLTGTQTLPAGSGFIELTIL